jgi:hypothetical protein
MPQTPAVPAIGGRRMALRALLFAPGRLGAFTSAHSVRRGRRPTAMPCLRSPVFCALHHQLSSNPAA